MKRMIFKCIGVKVETPLGSYTCRAILLLCSTDLPAQAQLLNMKYFNGKYACAHCEDEGVPRQACPRVRDWPFRGEAILRTHSSILCNARDAITQHNAVS